MSNPVLRGEGWEQLTVANIIDAFFESHEWQRKALIVQHRGEWQVRFCYSDRRDGTEEWAGLRCSRGPRQGYFWDIYGDNLHSPALAFYALVHAPVPPPLLGQYFSAKFTLRNRAATEAADALNDKGER